MSKLEAFLQPIEEICNREVLISKRFIQDDQPVEFMIHSITQEQNHQLIRQSTKHNAQEETFDAIAYNNKLIVACTSVPDFTDVALCKRYGTLDPEAVPEKMLYAGEYSALLDAIEQVCGFRQQDLRAEAKNC